MIHVNQPETAFNPSDPMAVESAFAVLEARNPATAQDWEKWLHDLSDVTDTVGEEGSRIYVDKSSHTADKDIEKRFLSFVTEVSPVVERSMFRLKSKFLAHPATSRLTDPKYALLLRDWKTEASLFREDNVVLETKVAETTSEYDKLSGQMSVTHEGRTLTLQQAGALLEDPNRELRENVWRKIVERKLQDAVSIEARFDELYALRNTMARNAGFKTTRDFYWKAKLRHDYTPADCEVFAEAIRECCLPLARDLIAERAREMKVGSLRPWDTAVDPRGRKPLRPFPENSTSELESGVEKIFSNLSPELASHFGVLRRERLLDLDSRHGKQPGGYQTNFDKSRRPFIFMNAAGTQRDVETLLHEGGHAFHYMDSCHEPLAFVRQAPMEFCEVASMTMELFGGGHLNVFYGEEEAKRARRAHLEGVVRLFTSMASVDLFQHWLYTRPECTAGERTVEWMRLQKSFGTGIDWSGLEKFQAQSWHSTMHIFHSPFYYVEYGIAQIGALQLWAKFGKDPKGALADYRRALALGGSKPLPELFRQAGIKFDFSRATLGPLMDMVRVELARTVS